jgi:hypothetical protein
MSDIPIFGAVDRLPYRVGILWLADVDVYPDPRAGVGFRYIFPDEDKPPPRDEFDPAVVAAERARGPKPELSLVKADAFLYHLGLSALPSDVTSDQMREILQHAFNDIGTLIERGEYQHFEVLMSQMLAMPPHTGEPVWLWLSMRYRQATKPNVRWATDCVSHLVVRTDGGYINKIRYTYPASLAPQLAYSGFLLFLFEWKHSVDRVLTGRSAIPPEGDKGDAEWMRMVAELKDVRLPHPLGFFDETLVAARQAEIVSDHFAASGYDQERKLEVHETGTALLHEFAHTIFAGLEKDMAIELDYGGLGSFVDARPPERDHSKEMAIVLDYGGLGSFVDAKPPERDHSGDTDDERD